VSDTTGADSSNTAGQKIILAIMFMIGCFFSYGQSQVEKVYKYIQNQEEHHKKQTFKVEYVELLKKFNIDYDEQYLFHDLMFYKSTKLCYQQLKNFNCNYTSNNSKTMPMENYITTAADLYSLCVNNSSKRVSAFQVFPRKFMLKML